MAIDVDSIRAIINLEDGTAEGDPVELSDDAIESAISRSETFVSDLAIHSGISATIVELAKLNYAAYLAYLTYADRIVEQLPGSFDQQGVFQPIANPVAKQAMAKLACLKQTSDEILDIIRNTPQKAALSEVPMPADFEDYPKDFKLSNLDDVWSTTHD